MSKLTTPTTSAEVSDDWIQVVREIIAREKPKVRPHATLPIIEVFSHRTDAWHPLNLQNDSREFATIADRDAVLAKVLA